LKGKKTHGEGGKKSETKTAMYSEKGALKKGKKEGVAYQSQKRAVFCVGSYRGGEAPMKRGGRGKKKINEISGTRGEGKSLLGESEMPGGGRGLGNRWVKRGEGVTRRN